MKDNHAKVFVASLKNISKKLTYYGDADIRYINMLKLIYKYVEYSTVQTELQELDKKVSWMQRSQKEICMEKQANLGYIQTAITSSTVDITINSPTLDDVSITVTSTGYYITIDEMLAGYSDPNNTDASLVVISTLPANGILYYGTDLVVAGQSYIIVDDMEFSYVRESSSSYSSSFTYTVYNSAEVPLESNTATLSITADEITSENEPATIGDTALFSDNRETITLTLANFTTDAVAAYDDPDGDALDAIRIDRISGTNAGTFYYYGTEVVVDQVITAGDLSAGAFTYGAPDINSIQTDVLEVSIRDAGSLEWVS